MSTKRSLLARSCGGTLFALLLLVTVQAEGDDPAKKPEKNTVSAEARVRNLQSQLSTIEQGLSGVDGRLPGLKQKVKDLLEKTSSIRPPEEKKEEPEDKPQPQTVEFRPPLLRSAGGKEPSLTFFCKENRVFVLDVKAFNVASDAAIDQATRNGNDRVAAIRQALAKGRKYPLPSGDCDVIIEDPNERQIGDSLSWNPKIEAVVKNGHPGETVESIMKPKSGYRSYLDKINPDKSYLQYTVYPDSFQIFREMRAIAWERKFGVNWFPRVAGEPFTSGGGSGGVQ